jgi:hypothetical protein
VLETVDEPEEYKPLLRDAKLFTSKVEDAFSGPETVRGLLIVEDADAINPTEKFIFCDI